MNENMNGENRCLDKCVCVFGGRGCNSLQANSLAKQVTKWSMEETSEIIWSNPSFSRSQGTLAYCPMQYKRMLQET